jgi:hypothetical protein
VNTLFVKFRKWALWVEDTRITRSGLPSWRWQAASSRLNPTFAKQLVFPHDREREFGTSIWGLLGVLECDRYGIDTTFAGSKSFRRYAETSGAHYQRPGVT